MQRPRRRRRRSHRDQPAVGSKHPTSAPRCRPRATGVAPSSRVVPLRPRPCPTRVSPSSVTRTAGVAAAAAPSGRTSRRSPAARWQCLERLASSSRKSPLRVRRSASRHAPEPTAVRAHARTTARRTRPSRTVRCARVRRRTRAASARDTRTGTGCSVTAFAPRQVVGRCAADLLRRERGRHVGDARRTATPPPCPARRGSAAVTAARFCPVDIVRVGRQAEANRGVVVLVRSWRNRASRVARPHASSRTPVASGSSVPA